jgi:hypothetical protein
MDQTYKILNPPGRETAIECLVCGKTSFHPKDVEYLYCGNCHRFHDTVETPPLTQDAYRLLKALRDNEGPPEGLTDSPHRIMVSFFQRGLLERRDGMIYVTTRGDAAVEKYAQEA